MRTEAGALNPRAAALWRLAAWAVISAAMAGTCSAVQALVVEPQLLMFRRTLPIPGDRLAQRLSGVTTVHLTDLHVHGMGLRERRLAASLREIAPDLVLLTGDLAETPEGIAALGDLLGAIEPELGIFAVAGNNEYQKGEWHAIHAALRGAGVSVLTNAHAVIQAPGGPVAVAGVDDPHTGRDDIAMALEGIPSGMPVIVLAHSTSLLDHRGRALMINPYDTRGPWGRGWFWQDGTHVRPDSGDVWFERSGPQTLRVQAREDGVVIDEIRLAPRDPAAAPRRWGQRFMTEPRHVEGEIVITAGQIAAGDLHGGWISDSGRLEHGPDRGLLSSSAAVEPRSYFDARFTAQALTRYHVWAHLWSHNVTGTSDSIYVQFSDSVDADGEPDYRIGVASPRLDPERVDLILAGHTHGGQVRLPWVGALEPSVRSNPWIDGVYQVGSAWLEVSRGAGWSSLPVRFWCTPQIVVFIRAGEDDARTL